MSSYQCFVKIKATGEIKEVTAIDNYWGPHRYGYMLDNEVFLEDEVEIMPEKTTFNAPLIRKAVKEKFEKDDKFIRSMKKPHSLKEEMMMQEAIASAALAEPVKIFSSCCYEPIKTTSKDDSTFIYFCPSCGEETDSDGKNLNKQTSVFTEPVVKSMSQQKRINVQKGLPMMEGVFKGVKINKKGEIVKKIKKPTSLELIQKKCNHNWWNCDYNDLTKKCCVRCGKEEDKIPKKPKECKHEWKPSPTEKNWEYCVKCGGMVFVGLTVESRDEVMSGALTPLGEQLKTIEQRLDRLERRDDITEINSKFIKMNEVRIAKLESKVDEQDIWLQELDHFTCLMGKQIKKLNPKKHGKK